MLESRLAFQIKPHIFAPHTNIICIQAFWPIFGLVGCLVPADQGFCKHVKPHREGDIGSVRVSASLDSSRCPSLMRLRRARHEIYRMKGPIDDK